MDHLDPITRILQEGIEARVFPGAVLLVRHHAKICIYQAVGLTSSFPQAPPAHVNTIYDLASLTKPLATVSSILLLVQAGQVSLAQSLEKFLEETKGFSVGQVSLKCLLSHQSGLPAWKPFYQSFSPLVSCEPELRHQRMHAILKMIVKEPISHSLPSPNRYSDLGFILLGCVVERVTGQSLADFCREQIFKPLQARTLDFGIQDVKDEVSNDVAPTEEDLWRGRLLQGEVHDENAAVIGGVAGHAGLFGTAEAVGQVTKSWLDAYLGKPSIFTEELVKQFVKNQPATSWALGWDTPSQPSSSGQWFSSGSFGHLGFTGTSIWIDPMRELEVIFLSNRVHPTRDNQAIKTFRPKLHDVIIQGL